VKRTALLKQIARAAGDKGLDWKLVRAGGQHDIYQLGTSVRVSIPRHRDINEITAEAILKAAGHELGEEWWR
jgi:predicted RNA binding protein YcfA (HicA-like mRNA interferase family)